MNKTCQALLELNALLQLGDRLEFKWSWDDPEMRAMLIEVMDEEINHKIDYICPSKEEWKRRKKLDAHLDELVNR